MRIPFSYAVYSALHPLPENEQKETYEKFVYASGRAAFEIGYWLFDYRGASRVDESKVTCPVLVVAGSQTALPLHRSSIKWRRITVLLTRNSGITPTGSWANLIGKRSLSMSATGSSHYDRNLEQ